MDFSSRPASDEYVVRSYQGAKPTQSPILAFSVREALRGTQGVFPGVAYTWCVPHAPGPRPANLRDTSGELLLAVYEHLKAIAHKHMASENAGHTLQATALVHEAFLRIGSDRTVPFENRGHFFAAAAEAMRRVLIDHARAKGAAKRGGGAAKVPLSVADLASDCDPAEILALDEALARLEKQEPEVADVVRLRFFAGLSGDETAEVLGVSPRQVDRLWSYARAWLLREMAS